MEILKAGVIKEEVTIFQGTCRKCGCIIRGFMKEWERVDAHNLHGGLHYRYACPTKGCNQYIHGDEVK